MATAVPAYSVRPAPAARTRLDSIDLLRGIVMVIMVLDHTRDFVHGPALRYDPTDLASTSFAIFMTRWITHFCAPVFVFLAGVSAYLQKMRGKSIPDLSRFLLTRGIWLIAVEIVVLHALIWFNLDFSFVGPLQVIWAIGWSMVVLAALVHLPLRVIGVFGIAMIALHNTLDGVSSQAFPWMVLHQAGLVMLTASGPLVWVQYPLVPWIGVMAAGYAFGAVYELEAERRTRLVRRVGLFLIAAFVVIRAMNIYGDPSHWSVQSTALFTVLSFINTTKYPPSLLYLLMTLGPALAALAWFDSRAGSAGAAGRAGEAGAAGRAGPFGPARAALVTFGRVPLFFYLLQWPLAHTAAIVANVVAGSPFDYLLTQPPAFFNLPWGTGFHLWTVYLCWACIIAIEYPLCRWFAGAKQRRQDWWLSYL
ncbi:MAG TPA: heparan-alpha-glucosaminide N-acetyltransferase domain-containing protein [Vicinamibacterales bacterium]|nr:heparan-alpha-glucosaminide N-acetyltransferase domain-containing protein [Vicinamibacterales bacterium]